MIIKMYYGNGNCSIQDSKIIGGIHIFYSGKIIINDKTPLEFNLIEKNNQILIFSLSQKNIILNNLFDYKGNFKIKNVIIADKDANKIQCGLKPIMHYSELMDTNAEDLDFTGEKLNSGYLVNNPIENNSLDQSSINNLNTANHDGNLYLEDGTEYIGEFHIHKKTCEAMTGSMHSENSETLYTKLKNDQLISTKNTTSVPPGLGANKRNNWIKKTFRISGFLGRLSKGLTIKRKPNNTKKGLGGY